jgi:hypothetical protein
MAQWHLTVAVVEHDINKELLNISSGSRIIYAVHNLCCLSFSWIKRRRYLASKRSVSTLVQLHEQFTNRENIV